MACDQKNPGGENCFLSKNNPLNIYKPHQIEMTELEIGAFGTDFSRRTSWWAREDPGRAKPWKSMENEHLCSNAYKFKKLLKCNEFKYFWMRLGAS
jgi:hypothetical protein